ncbi:MAG: class I mannose-6-phosphate isomerase [Anaerolineaceae bacterium]|jgi:mannose-6-phosphate isomerase|nr:class I mannose-6-phosphate isomerase [Anaerolineaceae bacterium]
MTKKDLYPLFLEPTIKNYIWGGTTFKKFLNGKKDHSEHIAEVWVFYGHNQIKNGPWAAKTLRELVNLCGPDLLGSFYPSTNFENFPLLIKLLDCQEWLSIQVHPNDQQAVDLEGAGFNGKTEGWYILDAAPDAQLIAGLKADIDQDALAIAIRNGTITSQLRYHSIQKDDFIFIPAGTIHALGPGALVYEIQQNSDVTYRVYDWDRPASNGRPLHIEKSLSVTNTKVEATLHKAQNQQIQKIFTCDYFSLDLYQSPGLDFELQPNGESFHALTVIAGSAEFDSESDHFILNQYESVLVPASYPQYHLQGDFKILKGCLNRK